MEFWTTVRFMLYPVMLVAGGAWAVLMLRHYNSKRCAEVAWAFWLGAAVALQGLSGFVALLVSKTVGLGALTSLIFSVGPLAVTVVTATGAVMLLMSAWRHDG